MQTACCVVGGGPAGVVLSLLLARQGVPVVLLEMHLNFDRDFRGDTIHPSVLEILDEIGLAGALLELPHAKLPSLAFVTPAEGRLTVADFTKLNTRFPYILLIPQALFLEFLVERARAYPSFTVIMNANVQELIQEDGTVRGVRYTGIEGVQQEVRALLTVGADGRFSRVRRLAGVEPVKKAPPMDVLWFRLPRQPGSAETGGALYFGTGEFMIAIDRIDYWQIGYVIRKGGYQQLHAAGTPALRDAVRRLVPQLAEDAQHLQDWSEVSLLSVESSRVRQWYRLGLLLIGDAAHVMSPVGGVGINYAIQDAVAAANILGPKLIGGRVDKDDLRAVQRKREMPVRVIQALQAQIQKRVVSEALSGAVKPFRVPLLIRIISRIPLLYGLPARLMGFGFGREHVSITPPSA